MDDQKREKRIYDKEYFKLKMRERRKQNKLIQKKYLYVIEINGSKYAFLQKNDIPPIKRIKKDEDVDFIKCF